ncbi:MAG TPA: TetR/AcrR family transcriptional regulator [Ktedonobacteraceae bacterium]|nr:TetR/AcrR family transcriptional regulator [Ktedonobacteraceae bacterium]
MSRASTIDARRARILDAALEVLASEGISETTTRKIAARAEVNQAMLRYYFGSKDDLLFAVLQEMMHITREVVQQAIPEGKTLRETLLEGLMGFWKHVEARPDLQIMQYELTLYALRSPTSAWMAQQQYDGYCAVVEMLLEEGFATLGECSVMAFPELARFVVGGMDGLILQFISNRNITRARLDLAHLVDAVIALAESGVSGERKIENS